MAARVTVVMEVVGGRDVLGVHGLLHDFALVVVHQRELRFLLMELVFEEALLIFEHLNLRL